jgi:O-antigen ligase
MPAQSSSLQQSALSGLGLAAGLFGLVALGALGGFALAIGEVQALWVALSVIAGIAILVDFRIGAMLLVLLLPIADTTFFPHALLGVTGLNPLNLLMAATLLSYVLRGRLLVASAGALLPKPLIWLFEVTIVIGGLLGAPHADHIAPWFYENQVIHFYDASGYLRDMLFKPMFIVVIAVLIGAAAARAQRPERFIIPIALSVWLIALIEIGFVLASGVRFGLLAASNAREFFDALGMHANDLGRLFALAYALLLFTWWETKSVGLKSFLFVSMGLLAFALLLTFSRGAFMGFLLVNALFLAWKFNAKTLGLAVLGLAMSLLVLPNYVFERVLLGFGSGGSADAVSAGRIDGIWMPLMSEVFRSPLWGNGLGFVMWSTPMQTEVMLPVTHPHNAFLESYLDVGAIGLALIVCYYISVWRGFRALGSNAYLSPELRGFFQGGAAALLCFAITGFAGGSLRPDSEFVYLWMAIGMMYGVMARRPAG